MALQPLEHRCFTPPCAIRTPARWSARRTRPRPLPSR